jgi:hypothetical protein
MSRNLWIALVCLIFSAGSAFAQEATKAPTTGSVKSAPQDSAPQDKAPQDKAREQKLADYLSGVKFVGSFTVTGSAERPPEPESYYILSAEKMDDGDWWKLTARIKYSTYDLTVPMAMEIKWAGETPVITVDQMAVPGMGTLMPACSFAKGATPALGPMTKSGANSSADWKR